MRLTAFIAATFAATAVVVLAGVPASPPAPEAKRVSGFTITEYYRAPERWFYGPKRSFPGVSGRHHVSWFLSAKGIAMEGDGVSRDGRYVSYASGNATWLNARGKPSRLSGGKGNPEWVACGWRNRRNKWTWPRLRGAVGETKRWRWSRGKPKSWHGCSIRFKEGPSRPLKEYGSVAVDPQRYELRKTWFRIRAYRFTRCNGWFRADDTGGAIRGRHLDVYRPAPRVPAEARYMSGKRVRVTKDPPRKARKCYRRLPHDSGA